MPQDVKVRFTFPFAQFIFWGWLPLAKEDEIVVEEGDLSMTVQFVERGGLLPPEEIVDVSEKNNFVPKIATVVTVRDVPDELVAGIHRQSRSTNTDRGTPRHLAGRVLEFVIARVNRVISYARNIKGQYWLSEIEYDPDNLYSALTKFKCQVEVRGSIWSTWNPASAEFVSRDGMLVDPVWCIQRGDWGELKDFVAAAAKPPLVGHLLAEAQWHAEQGHLRVALTEGVAALEAAINAFAKSPAASQCLASLRSARIRVQSLPRLIEKFGLRGTLDVLFPVIFHEAELRMDLLEDCVSAVDNRGMVIHHGQRSLDANTVRRYVASLRRMCNFLKSRGDQSSEA